MKFLEICPTINVPAVSSGAFPDENKTRAPAAHIIAISPSVIIVE